MTTQMNTTDADIAGKIDGVTRGGVQVKKDSHNDTLWVTDGENYIHVESGSDYLDHCRAVVDEVDGPAKPTDIERIIYALQLWMKRIVMGVPAHSQEGWEVRWERLEKVITDWKAKGEMPK